jgi:oligopeptide transport system ATP-binding protein
MTSLNPLLTVGTQLCDVIKLHQCVPHEQAKKIAIDLLDKVGIVDPEKAFSKQPIAFSGGQKQRIVIAIVLAAKPNVLVADEPTTALDVTIQKQILSLIMKLKDQLNFTLIFITHDLSLVANIADRVAVMYNGNIVEYGTCREIFADPRHPYT